MNRLERYLVPLLLLLAAAAYASPIFSPLRAVYSGNAPKDADWLKIAAFERFARDSLAHGALAKWCPYFGGGYPLVAHPEDGSLSPLTIPSYLCGEEVGMKLQLVIVLFLGAWGVYLAARRAFDFAPVAAMTAALGLLVAGWMAWRVNYGWPMHFGYYLFPLVFYFTVRAMDDRRWLLAATAVMVVILQQIAQGLPFFFLFLLAWAVARDLGPWPGVRRGAHTLTVIALAATTAVTGALKVLGLVQLLGVNTRWVPYADYRAAEHFYTGLMEWGRFVVREYDVFYKNIGLGWWIAALAALGLVLAWRRVWVLVPAVLLLVWIGLGPNAPFDLFVRLHRFPVFNAMHWPMKYTNFFVTFALVLFAGGAVDFAARRVPARARWLLAAVALLPLLPTALAHMRLLDSTFTRAEPPFPLAPSGFRQVAAYPGAPRGAGRPIQANMYWLLRQNRGTIDWDGDLLLPENATPAERIQLDGSSRPEPDYRGEVFLTVPGQINAWRVDVNRFTVRGRAEQAGRVVLNQNFVPGWRGSPRQVMVENGLLAMPVEAGPFAVDFVYQPAWFRNGLMIAVLGWFTLGLFWWQETSRRRRAEADTKKNGSDSSRIAAA